MQLENKIKKYLQKLNPSSILVVNNSHKHINHLEAKKGGHYEIIIVSSFFENKSKINRHRIINNILKNLFKNDIHALSITALTQEEWHKKQ